jgi:hypothetical protein
MFLAAFSGAFSAPVAESWAFIQPLLWTIELRLWAGKR